IGQPRWMASPQRLAEAYHSSMVIAFTNKDDAQKLLDQRVVWCYGRACYTAKYIERPPTKYCSNCQSLYHRTIQCKTSARCRICAQDHHTDNHICSTCHSKTACEHTPAKCCNCGGPHEAGTRSC
ncbi:hypothetical protein SISSUDRAFT_963580, partial [Sistotremastrum suecicum HHB10207 ss-3]